LIARCAGASTEALARIDATLRRWCGKSDTQRTTGFCKSTTKSSAKTPECPQPVRCANCRTGGDGAGMGYTHRKVAENGQTIVYERTDEGLFGWGILAAGDKDYVAIDNQTGAAVSGSTVGEARVKLEQLEGTQ
jgi:hypothetical protein